LPISRRRKLRSEGGNVDGDVHLEQTASPDGIPDHCIVVRLSKKF
jgi:hypothetical protein